MCRAHVPRSAPKTSERQPANRWWGIVCMSCKEALHSRCRTRVGLSQRVHFIVFEDVNFVCVVVVHRRNQRVPATQSWCTQIARQPQINACAPLQPLAIAAWPQRGDHRVAAKLRGRVCNQGTYLVFERFFAHRWHVTSIPTTTRPGRLQHTAGANHSTANVTTKHLPQRPPTTTHARVHVQKPPPKCRSSGGCRTHVC